MPHKFKLEKPSNIATTFKHLQQKLTAANGKLTGNEKEGTISVEGVEGQYTVMPNAIEITITKKPASIIPSKLIEKQIRKLFNEICD